MSSRFFRITMVTNHDGLDILEFMTGYTSTPVWDLLLPLAQTPDRRDQRLLMPLPKDTKWGEQNCPSFETVEVD